MLDLFLLIARASVAFLATNALIVSCRNHRAWWLRISIIGVIAYYVWQYIHIAIGHEMGSWWRAPTKLEFILMNVALCGIFAHLGGESRDIP